MLSVTGAHECISSAFPRARLCNNTVWGDAHTTNLRCTVWVEGPRSMTSVPLIWHHSASTMNVGTAEQMLNNTSWLFSKSKLDNIPLKFSPRGKSYKLKGTAQLLNPTTAEWPLLLLQKFHFAKIMLFKWTRMKLKLKKNGVPTF